MGHPRTSRGTGRRLRARLIAPALVVAACLVAFAGLRAWQLRRAQQELQLSLALQQAGVSARSLDAVVAETRLLLVSLGELLDPKAGPEETDAVLRRIFRAAPMRYANLWVADTTGHALGAARYPPAGRAGFAIADRGYFRRALRDRRFAIGEIVASRTLPGQPQVLTFALPVIDSASRRVRSVVGASIEVDSLDVVRAARAMPDGTVLTIMDSGGTVVYRTLDAAHWINRRFAIDSGKVNDFRTGEGVGRGRSADGTYRLTGFRRMQAAPWVVYVGIPVQYTLDVVRDEFIRDLVVGTLITLLILFFGYRSTLGIVIPIESLTADARAIAEGDSDRRSAVNSRDEIGDLARAFNTMADTVDQRNEALRASQDHLLHAQKMEALGSFAGGIAHDFNNCLAAIVAYGELARDSLDDHHAARRDINDVLSAAARASELTRQILVFSRRQIVERTSVDLNAVVAGIERMLARLVGEERRLVVTYAEAPVTVVADHGQLEQVVVNLITNARDALPDGGTVRLRIGRLNAAAGDARVPAALSGVFGQLVVEDEGVGIGPETLSQIFDPFFSTKARGQGTGLGLALAHSIIEQSGGVLSATSAVGVGTTMSLVLPLCAEDPADHALRPGSTAPAPAGRSGRILLAEDDAAVRTSAERMLANAGYTLVSTEDGASALRALKESLEPFDLLLTDVVMPGMSGSALARQVREYQPGIGLLYMSGYADDASVLDAVASSGVRCVSKPFTTRTLLDAVDEAKSNARPIREASASDIVPRAP